MYGGRASESDDSDARPPYSEILQELQQCVFTSGTDLDLRSWIDRRVY